MRTFLFCGLLACAAAADTVSLKLKIPKGQSIKVEQSLVLTSSASPTQKHKSGASVNVITQTPFGLAEKWTDTCLDDSDGDPVEVRRFITSSRISTAKAPLSPTTQEGCIFVLSKTDKGASVKTEKGKPEDLSIKLLEKGPPELMDVILPPGPVRPGESWKVDGAVNSPLQYIVSAGKAGAQGNAKNALRVDIDRMDDKKSPIGVGNATSAGCEVTATLKSVDAGVATIELAGEKEIDTDTIAGAPAGTRIPKSRTVIKGTLTFDVQAGRPLKLTWHSNHIVDDLETDNGKWPGFTETWVLTRTYSK